MLKGGGEVGFGVRGSLQLQKKRGKKGQTHGEGERGVRKREALIKRTSCHR